MYNALREINKYTIFYYLFLLLVLCSWSNPNMLPPLPLRLFFLGLVIFPLFSKHDSLYTIILCTFVVISAHSHAVSFMPVDGLYILLVFLVGIFVKKRKCHYISIPISFIMFAFLSLFIDIAYSSEVKISFPLFCIILAACYVEKNNILVFRLMTYSFVLISAVISIEFILFGSRYTGIVETVEGVVLRKGWMDPNYFGIILGYGVVTTFIELFTNPNLKLKYKYILYLVIISSLYVIFTTASRGAILSLGCSILFMLLFSPIRFVYKISAILLLLVSLIIMYYMHFLDLLLLRFISDEGDAGGRTQIWLPRINAFLHDFSFLEQMTGIGMHRGMLLATDKFLGFHNDFVASLICYGFIGFSCLLSLLWYPIRLAKTYKRFVIATVIYMALSMITIEPFTGSQWGCLYFYLYILTLSQINHAEKV